jgi:uncharacterized protein YndB with AHSA1/START domain
MTGCFVMHDTFTIERSYPATPSRVFAAFTSPEARSNWGDLVSIQGRALRCGFGPQFRRLTRGARGRWRAPG